MAIGDRIKKRRIEIGLSVDQLADKIGKNRATVYRYESKEIEKFPIDVLSPLAEALCTTPAYLMGWDDTPTAYNSDEYPCPETEKDRLVSGYHSYIIQYPNRSTQDRITVLFNYFHPYFNDILMYLGINLEEVNDWIHSNVMPAPQTVRKILAYFELSPADIMDSADCVEFDKRSHDARYYIPFTDWGKNIIGIASHDGSYEERELTDDQLVALKAFLQLMPPKEHDDR